MNAETLISLPFSQTCFSQIPMDGVETRYVNPSLSPRCQQELLWYALLGKLSNITSWGDDVITIWCHQLMMSSSDDVIDWWCHQLIAPSASLFMLHIWLAGRGCRISRLCSYAWFKGEELIPIFVGSFPCRFHSNSRFKVTKDEVIMMVLKWYDEEDSHSDPLQHWALQQLVLRTLQPRVYELVLICPVSKISESLF